jgi:uroporphyrinogen-III synthase
MTTSLPLAGLNIVVTRPRDQAAQLVQSILALGGVCTQFPLLEITPLADDRALHRLISRLHEFHLAIFISPNAVRFGMEAIIKAGGLPGTMQVASVGLSSAKALLEYGVKKVISPQQRFDSEALLELPELQKVRDKNIVIFRGDSGRELLGDTLKLRGAQVEYIGCYLRSKPQHDVNDLLEARPDALTVSSSEALNYLTEMLGPAGRERLFTLPLFVSHSRIAAAAQQQGWQHIVTAAAGEEGLLSALITWAELRKTEAGNRTIPRETG